LSIDHSLEITDSFKDQVLSINAARNCFVHRHGAVSDRDVNDEGVLEVKWTRHRIFIQNEDGEQDLIIGKVLEVGSKICMKVEEKEKPFSIGDQLSFSIEEMSEIIWCFFLFGNELVMNISKFGISIGFIQSTGESSA
jgi:hypothetical protein